MDREAARAYVDERMRAIGHEDFEVLCKIAFESAETTRDLELTPFRADGGIDLRVVVDRELFRATVGVQVKQYAPDNPVGVQSVRRLKGALAEAEYDVGTFVTSSRFTSGAVESAERFGIRLVDGDALLDVLCDSEVGVVRTEDGYAPDPSFWAAFEGPVSDATIPSIEVPQADSFDTLRAVLRAVDGGATVKPTIADRVRRETGDSFDPRQADYYATAGWLLGLLHKDRQVELDGVSLRRWGLTRAGERYLAHLDEGDDAAADDLLCGAIRDVAVVDRCLDRLGEAGELSLDALAEVIDAETELSGTTTTRRARTVRTWLAALPEVDRDGAGVRLAE